MEPASTLLPFREPSCQAMNEQAATHEPRFRERREVMPNQVVYPLRWEPDLRNLVGAVDPDAPCLRID